MVTPKDDEASSQAERRASNRSLLKSLLPVRRHKVKGKGDDVTSITQNLDNQGVLSDTAETVASRDSGHSAKGIFWPKDLLPKVIPDARVFTYGYDVNINHLFSSASQATVFQHAASFLNDLANERISAEAVSSSVCINESVYTRRCHC